MKVATLSARLREGAESVRRKARKHPPEYRKFMEKHIQELLEVGLIYKTREVAGALHPLFSKSQE